MRLAADTITRCPTCKGEGIIAGTRRADGSIDTCKTCHGRGEVTEAELRQPCERCAKIIQPNRCEVCRACGRRVHIDGQGHLLWPREGGVCSTCYDKIKNA